MTFLKIFKENINFILVLKYIKWLYYQSIFYLLLFWHLLYDNFKNLNALFKLFQQLFSPCLMHLNSYLILF